MRQLEFQLEETRAEVAHKSRLNQELTDSVNDMKAQMADIREQKNTCENEVSFIHKLLIQLIHD